MSSNYTYITGAATTVIGPAAGTGTGRRIALTGIAINKALTGTLTIKSGATTLGQFAAGTAPGILWDVIGGVEIPDLQIVTSATEDITVFWTNF
jgi:hypothetical protein